MGIFSRNGTRHQKGHAWATRTLVACGAFSIYANVRSGQIAAEPVIISAFPPIVAFLTSKLIAYFNPNTRTKKFFVYGGFGLVCAIAMGASGFHIVETVVRNGQPWYVGLMYVLITDLPMLLAAGVLVQKVSTNLTVEKPDKTPVTATIPTQTTIPAKKAVAAKTTKPAAKRTTPAKTTKPSTKAPTPSFSAQVDDPAELSTLRDGASR